MKLKNNNGETIKAGCVLVNEQQQVLLVLSDYEHDLWAFPKGHAEPDELPEDTALREVQEETGYKAEITARLPDATYSKEDELIRITFFQARPIGEEEKVEREIIQKWFSIDEARQKLRPNLVFLLNHIR